MHEPILPACPPPSSPPSTALLANRVMKQRMAQAMKTTTLKPKEPAGTQYSPSVSPVLKSGASQNLLVYLAIYASPQGSFSASAAGTVQPPDHREATTQGRPSPRKTLTELDPVTFPIALSAYLSALAAAIEAKVSGREVPRATNVIAVIEGLMPRMQPKRLANSPTTAVTIPMTARAEKKQAHPPA